MSSRRVRSKQSKLTRHICGPFRVLARAWDSYLKGMTGLSGPLTYGNAVGYPVPHIPTFHSSYRTRATTVDDELRDLIRLATARRLTGKFDAPGFHRPKSVVPVCSGGTATPDAFELPRIDEDREF